MMNLLHGENTRSRSILIATITGGTLLILAITVFAVASQSRSVSTQAAESVSTVENLRVLSLARSEIGLASRAAAAATDETAVIQGAIENANLALDSVENNFNENTREETLDAFANFRAAVDDQTTVLSSNGQNQSLLQEAEVATGEAFATVGAIMRDDQLAAVEDLEAANDLMNIIATIATFIVAFVVPSAALFVFQALQTAPRELRELRFEHDRLQRRSSAIANTVIDECTDLSRRLSRGEDAPSVGELRGELRRFVNIASMNGSASSIRNQRFDTNAVLGQVIDDLDARSTVLLPQALDPFAFADKQQFEVVASELISNALEHGKAPYEVLTIPTENEIEIHVRDSGHGLSDEIVQGAVLDQESNLRNGALEGTLGYGLIAVRRSLESMGGSLRYERANDITALIASMPSAIEQPTSAQSENLAA